MDAKTPREEIDGLAVWLTDILIQAQRLNADEPTRSRELSLAITKIEEGIHWIQAWLLHTSLQREIVTPGE